MKPGPATSTDAMPSSAPTPSASSVASSRGFDPERLRELERDVRGPVAVVAVLRALEHDVVRRHGAAASLRNVRRDGEDGGRQVGGIHETQAYRRCAQPRPPERPAGMAQNGGMRDSARLTLPVAIVAASIALLAGCVDDPAPVPTPSTSTTPSPSATAGEPTPTPTPTSEPVSIDCVSLVPADAFATLFTTFTLVPGYVPAAGSVAAEVAAAGGTVCGWTAADGTTVAVGVAAIDAATIDAKANELVVSSHSVPTYGIEGYFQVSAGVGEVQAFSDPYWIVATSTAFMEPGEVGPIMDAVIAALQ